MILTSTLHRHNCGKKEDALQYCTHQTVLGSKEESQGSVFVTSAQDEGIHQENIFTIQLAARIYFHKSTYRIMSTNALSSLSISAEPLLPLQRREAILLIYKYLDFPTILKKYTHQ